MTAPQRIQLRRTAGWRKPDDAIVVSRPGRWGNPFTPGGDHPTDHRPITNTTEAVQLYRQHLLAGRLTYWDAGQRRRRPITASLVLKDLRGHDLACWCPPDQPCHADVLLELANPRKERTA